MNYRRPPFQFASTDPVARRAELEKRFGLPARKMYVDLASPLSTGTTKSMPSSSPRLQHRVPIFRDGHDQPIQSSVDSVGQTSETKKAPNVRVIPIQVEGDHIPSARHRTFSGPTDVSQVPHSSAVGDYCSLNRSSQDLPQPSKVKENTEGPRVFSVPVQIEGKTRPSQNTVKNHKVKVEHPTVNRCTISKLTDDSKNGCAGSKQTVDDKGSASAYEQPVEESKNENDVEISMIKIEDVLKELEPYERGVSEFSGTTKHKQYRYLDEMLTRCMLRLDDVETLGDINIRNARKSAVKRVQASIDLLEKKVNTENAKAISKQPTSEIANVDMKEEPEISEAGPDQNTDKVLEIQVAEDQKVEFKNNADKNSEDYLSGDQESDSAVEVNTLTVTEVGSDTDVEFSSQVPDVVEPNEAGMLENQLEAETNNCGNIGDKSTVAIEDITDSVAESTQVLDVEMTEVEPGTVKIYAS